MNQLWMWAAYCALGELRCVFGDFEAIYGRYNRIKRRDKKYKKKSFLKNLKKFTFLINLAVGTIKKIFAKKNKIQNSRLTCDFCW